MDDIKYFDRVIPLAYSNQIEDDLFRTTFPWYYIDDVTNVSYGNNSGLVHVAYDHGVQPSEWYPFIKPLVYSIAEAYERSIEKLLRIRVGFLLKTDEPEHTHNTPHVDFLFPHVTACYYVNDTDGDTVLFDKTLSGVGSQLTEKTVQDYVANNQFNIVSTGKPRKGSVCVFDGFRFHASSKPKNHNRRLVITVNYVPTN